MKEIGIYVIDFIIESNNGTVVLNKLYFVEKIQLFSEIFYEASIDCELKGDFSVLQNI